MLGPLTNLNAHLADSGTTRKKLGSGLLPSSAPTSVRIQGWAHSGDRKVPVGMVGSRDLVGG